MGSPRHPWVLFCVFAPWRSVPQAFTDETHAKASRRKEFGSVAAPHGRLPPAPLALLPGRIRKGGREESRKEDPQRDLNLSFPGFLLSCIPEYNLGSIVRPDGFTGESVGSWENPLTAADGQVRNLSHGSARGPRRRRDRGRPCVPARAAPRRSPTWRRCRCTAPGAG